MYHFYRTPEKPVPAPTMAGDAPSDNGEAPGCAIDPKSIPGRLSDDAYPASFVARSIEAWAIVGYDTAPRGQIGRTRVLASEPAEAFGAAAMQAIVSGRVADSESGRRGCVRRIRFRMPASGATTAPPNPIRAD